MKTLILKPGPERFDYAVLDGGTSRPLFSGKIYDYRSAGRCDAALEELAGAGLDLVAVRLPFGGASFTEPVLVTDDAMAKLDELAPQAPLHVPPAITLVEACRKAFPALPIVLVFETSFFAELPPRECRYALGGNAAGTADLRRYGFHGLFHQAASGFARRRLGARAGGPSARVLSVCLEPRPEIAAVIGRHPVMVTSGATPLEGLPGETSCGELDPSIVLTLADELKLGPEQVNAVLTQESGLTGLAGGPATLEDAFTSDEPRFKLARDVMSYRMLLAAGAGIAAMGGLDAIVFSGRFAELGRIVGPWLTGKIRLRGVDEGREASVEIFTETLDRIIADAASSPARARSSLSTV